MTSFITLFSRRENISNIIYVFSLIWGYPLCQARVVKIIKKTYMDNLTYPFIWSCLFLCSFMDYKQTLLPMQAAVDRTSFTPLSNLSLTMNGMIIFNITLLLWAKIKLILTAVTALAAYCSFVDEPHHMSLSIVLCKSTNIA